MAPIFAPGEAVCLRRPKGWKLGAKWTGPFEVVCRVGVDYKIKSSKGKITVVHHDRLKRGYALLSNGDVVCPARELGGDKVVYNVPTNSVQPICDTALIGTALLRNSTPRENTVVIRSICNILILVGKNSLLRNSVKCYFML